MSQNVREKYVVSVGTAYQRKRKEKKMQKNQDLRKNLNEKIEFLHFLG